MAAQAENPAVRRPRRLRRWLTLAVLGVVVAVLGTVLLMAGAFDVDRIRFRGMHRVSYDEAHQAVGIRVGDFMATLNAGRAEESLEAVPWVADAHVRRRWPGTVEVSIVERTEAAIVLSAPDSWVLADIHGRILSSPLSVLPELPRLSGIAAAPAPGEFLADDADGLFAVLRAAQGQPEFSVVALWRDRRGDVRARVRQAANGLVVEAALGDDSALGAKTAAIAAVIAEMTSADVILDVSVPHLPVLRPAAQPVSGGS